MEAEMPLGDNPREIKRFPVSRDHELLVLLMSEWRRRWTFCLAKKLVYRTVPGGSGNNLHDYNKA